MASIRQLPSGKWQATVRTGQGKRITYTHELKRAAEVWAAEREVEKSRGVVRDPRDARTTVAQWHDHWQDGRSVEASTAKKNASHWRVHVEPKWGRWQLASIGRADVAAWVKQMRADGASAYTIEGARNLLSTMLQAAVADGILEANPCKGVSAPPTPAGRLRFFTPGEQAQILDQLDEPHRTFADLLLHTGLRWGEGAGLHAEFVDHTNARLTVATVLTRDGLRDYPKSRKSNRVVPFPERLVGPLESLGRTGPLFRGANGGLFHDTNWRERVWRPALKRAGVTYAPPHTMRHTAASRLVQRGVSLYEVQALLGHESFATTQRYAHLAPDSDDAIRAAWG